uniref:RING-type domain-containing protein n=1 Tax=Parastrongyloides trichosuri TaxID=131310 RepID=A0A0N5A6Z5_PARTI
MNSNHLFFCSMFCRTAVPEYEIVALRTCGHTFHKQCIIAYFNVKNETIPNSSECPICRTPADMKSFLRIYVTGNILDLTDKKSVIENEDVINNCVELIAEQKRTIDNYKMALSIVSRKQLRIRMILSKFIDQLLPQRMKICVIINIEYFTY